VVQPLLLLALPTPYTLNPQEIDHNPRHRTILDMLMAPAISVISTLCCSLNPLKNKGTIILFL
jgi:hypothetical protein